MVYHKRHIRDVSQVNNRTVFGIGVIAGLASSGFLYIMRSSRWTNLNLEMILGTMFIQDVGASAWWLGFCLHLLLSGLIAFAYAFIFRSARRSGAGIGMNLSLFHWAITGIALTILPAIHPLIVERYLAPGMFAVALGLPTAVIFLLNHIVYGSVTGALFDQAAVRHRESRPITVG